MHLFKNDYTEIKLVLTPSLIAFSEISRFFTTFKVVLRYIQYSVYECLFPF